MVVTPKTLELNHNYNGMPVAKEIYLHIDAGFVTDMSGNPNPTIDTFVEDIMAYKTSIWTRAVGNL